jgi:folate-binding Fe-S cluster repair protein YgfZ
LSDAFVYRLRNGDFVVETDELQSQYLIGHLKRFVLRSKVVIEPASLYVWQLWDDEISSEKDFVSLESQDESVLVRDPRHNKMGYRLLMECMEPRIFNLIQPK